MSKGARDRASAKKIVEQQKAAERRRRVTVWTSVAVVAVLAIAGLIGWGVVSGQDRENADRLTTPSVAVDEGTAFAVGTGPVTVDLYEDFMCPICHELEIQAGPTLEQLAQDNKITLRYHPVAILDRFSNGTEFSTRAAGAVAAAAQDGKFAEFHKVLFDNQPEENTPGLNNAKLIELGRSVGLGDTFADAVDKGTFEAWAAKATETFASRGHEGTPTLLVAGKQVSGAGGGLPTAADITQAVDQAAG